MGATASDFEAFCTGAPGAVDLLAGIVRAAPNLDWRDLPLGEALRARLRLPVFMDNDVNVGVLGESGYGVGRGALPLVGIWVSTGIGGDLIVNGQLVNGWRDAAGEIGHMVVQPGGRRCGGGREGCDGAYASKTAMMAMIQEEIGSGRKSAVPEILAKKGKKRLIRSVVNSALEAEDPPLMEAVETAQFHLGLLTANLVNVLDPQVVVSAAACWSGWGRGYSRSGRAQQRRTTSSRRTPNGSASFPHRLPPTLGRGSIASLTFTTLRLLWPTSAQLSSAGATAEHRSVRRH